MKGNIYEVSGRFVVRFGRKITKWFNTLKEAERFLTGIRYENDKGTFDERDYASGNPLAFDILAAKWLDIKQEQVRKSTFLSIKKYIKDACSRWGGINVKKIGYADIEDHLISCKVSQKTRANIRSCLHDFWSWMVRRKVLATDQMPEFPSMPFELSWRRIISISDQSAILEEVSRISEGHNPKIALGIRMLCTYISIRPGELVKLKEKEILVEDGVMVISNTKDKKTKIIPLLPEDVEDIKRMPKGFPEQYFFRHTPGTSGVKAGQPFSCKYLYVWWKRACERLGIHGVDLYGGTRHSTAVSLKQILSPEQIRAGTMHNTNKAFERYIQSSTQDALSVYQAARDAKQHVQHLNNIIDISERRKSK